MNDRNLLIRTFGLKDYQDAWQAMRNFTDVRSPDTPSECWLLQHPPVFTQGQAGKPEHVLNAGDIPIVQSDRGGQITYHGPGQLILYLLLNLKEANKGVRQLVTAMENSVIALLADYGIDSCSSDKAPGVYVGSRKIAALGLRVRHGYTYHGLALNVDMDLEPYQRINPCGHAGQEVTQLKALGLTMTVEQAGLKLVEKLATELHYSTKWITHE